MGVSAVPLSQITMSVSALLALQRVLGISMLPAHLGIRPQLTRLGVDIVLEITDHEREVLAGAGGPDVGLIDAAGVPNPDVAVIMRALAAPDAEINVTLGAPERQDTFVCLIRCNELFVSAARCGDEVVIDAYSGWDERHVVSQLAATVEDYVFATASDDPAPIERGQFQLNVVYDALTSTAADEWTETLSAKGIPRSVARMLHRGETACLGRAEVAAYLNHEGVRSDPDTIVRLTATDVGAMMTSFASDNNRTRWLTVEPYEPDRLETLIIKAIRSVPQSAWFTHCRSD